jgi:hypothetical protein
MKIRDILVEADPKLKAAVTQAVKQTEDDNLLHKVLTTLKGSDLHGKLTAALATDQDATKYVEIIARIVIDTEGSVEEKERFAAQFKRGFINLGVLFGGNRVGWSDFVVDDFAAKVFATMAVSNELRPQGVGPGEIALAILSPKIMFTGQSAGGGDIGVAGVGNVEVKTRVQSAGRWGNARKARMDVGGIRAALEKAMGEPMPDRINIKTWSRDEGVREQLRRKNPRMLGKICDLIAKGTYAFTDTTAYATALKAGTEADLRDAMLAAAWENYKTYSEFDGMLIMDAPSQQAHYFSDFADMQGHIWASTLYILAPEQEMFPKVGLIP